MSKMIPGTNIVKPRVKLVGTDGNAFALMGKVVSALRKVDAPATVADEFRELATSGDYDDLLRACTIYVDVT